MKNFNLANNPYECIMLLKNINDLINTLYKMSDTKYYLEYIFNTSTTITEKINKMGIDEEYFMNLAEEFEMLRSLLYGDQIDWDGLVNHEIFKVAYGQNKEIEDKQKTIQNLEYQIRKQQEKK